MATTGPTAQNNPDFFVGKPILSAYEPYPILTASQYSSVVQSTPFIRWVQPTPVVVKNIVVQNSFAAGVPGATGQASSGSEAHSYVLSAFLFNRQDYTSNSTVLSFLTSGSFGLSASLGYTSTAQSFGMSWVTDTTGGQSTFSTSSNDAGWSNYANGPRVVSIPFVATLPAGEYWMGFQNSSTSATSNSNVTLLSVSQLQIVGQQASVSAGYLGQSTTAGSVYGAGQNANILSTNPTTSATMAITVLSIANRNIWFALSNA